MGFIITILVVIVGATIIYGLIYLTTGMTPFDFTPSKMAYRRARNNRKRQIRMGEYDGQLNNDALRDLQRERGW